MSEILTGKVVAVLVGTEDGHSIQHPKIQVFANRGIRGDPHFGLTRLADIRESELLRFGLQKGTEIANFRQFSAVSEPELIEIATGMGLQSLAFGLLAENLVLSLSITKLAPGTNIYFSKPDGDVRTAVLTVMSENLPCEIPAKNIAKNYPNHTFANPFQTAALAKRGVVGIVKSSGFIHENDNVKIYTK